MSGVSLMALRVYEIRDKSAKFGTRGGQMVTLISLMTRRRQWYSYSTIFCIDCLRNNGYNCGISYEAVTSKSALTTGTCHYLPTSHPGFKVACIDRHLRVCVVCGSALSPQCPCHNADNSSPPQRRRAEALNETAKENFPHQYGRSWRRECIFGPLSRRFAQTSEHAIRMQ